MAKKKKLDPYSSELELTDGTVVVCHRIEPEWLDLFSDEHKMPDPPKRQAKVVGGGTEWVDDVEDEEYQAALALAQTRRMEDMQVMVYDHVELRDEPRDDVVARMQRYGIEPTPQNLVRAHMTDYGADWALIQAEVFRLSTVTDEEVRKALDRFRHQLGRRLAPDEDGHTEEPVSGEGG